MKDLILKYLGYFNGNIDDKTEDMINKAITEVKEIAKFKYIYQEFTYLLPFIKQSEVYTDFLSGSSGYLLVATTIGIEIDKRIKYLKNIDIAYSVVFDAAASAYVEILADEYEKTLPYKELSYRFCPGYSGTSILDNIEIGKILNVSKLLGVSFSDSGLMMPMKSMIGIVGIGIKGKRSCKDCVRIENCDYLRRGTTCYQK